MVGAHQQANGVLLLQLGAVDAARRRRCAGASIQGSAHNSRCSKTGQHCAGAASLDLSPPLSVCCSPNPHLHQQRQSYLATRQPHSRAAIRRRP